MDTATRQLLANSGHRVLPMMDQASGTPLARDLMGELRGEVRFDAGSRALYATAASNYRQLPIGVVVPRDAADVVAAVDICRRHGAPVLSRGGGTSLAGQTTNEAVVLDFSKYMHGILWLDPERRLARVEPGMVLDDLRRRAEEFHLTFGPDPATHNHCTLGGMIGNNSCGIHSVMAGCTADNVERLEVLTYDGERFEVGPTTEDDLARMAGAPGRRGEIFREIRAFSERHRGAIRAGFPEIPRRVSGYNLPALLPEHGVNLARALAGSEGTLVTLLSATLQLVPSPRARTLLVLGYPDVFEAADHILEVREAGPIGLEGLDAVLVDDIKRKELHPERLDLLPPGHGWLLVEFGGDNTEESTDRARALMSRLGRTRRAPAMKLFTDSEQAEVVWKVRESGLGATARVPGQPDTWEGWEDAAVAPERLGAYLRAFRALLRRYEYRAALYGHFGQGCVHTRIPFDLRSPAGIARFRSFVSEAADLVLAHGGSLSGEHGDGQARAELLPKMFGPELLRAFSEWKAVWDPAGKMNPGKIVKPYRIDQNLRLGSDYHPLEVATHFQFIDDRGSFSYAAERCVGVGECRRLDGGTMCPSYMVTREEMHSTRGRARLLFEMMRGDAIRDGFRSEAVREALDLCLACKGCKSECPVNVDLATYKAEFLSHYYRHHLRPRSAYAFGLVYWWAQMASLLPGPVNFLTSAPGLSQLAKWAAGVHPVRTLPRFARVTFREWWRARPERGAGRPKVFLWVDTWCNHFQPAVAMAAVEVLEHAGFQVVASRGALCCGRPLYDHGMLTLAKRTLRGVLRALRPALRADIPVVGLEPSCISVFRDELPNLFPEDPDAERLRSGSYLLGEFLLREVPAWSAPALNRDAIVHDHCHHKSVLRAADHHAVLKEMGIRARILDSGCCGMAGAFGYERDHYAVAVACGERRLLPEVRSASERDILIADGFSCREQIAQQTGRRALHTAQVLQIAIQHGPLGPRVGKPEDAYAEVRLPLPRARLARNTAFFMIAAAGLYLWGRRRERTRRRALI